MKDLLGLIAVFLSFAAYLPYFKDIVSKKSVPHPYSWLIWSFDSFIIFGLQLTNGGGAGAYTTLSVAFMSLAVALLALRNGAARSITKSDTVVFIAAIGAAFLWLLMHQAALAIIILITAEILGVIPTIRKAWRRPDEETLVMWLLNTVRHGLSITALQQYNLVTLLNPIVWVIANGTVCIVIILRRRI